MQSLNSINNMEINKEPNSWLIWKILKTVFTLSSITFFCHIVHTQLTVEIKNELLAAIFTILGVIVLILFPIALLSRHLEKKQKSESMSDGDVRLSGVLSLLLLLIYLSLSIYLYNPIEAWLTKSIAEGLLAIILTTLSVSAFSALVTLFILALCVIIVILVEMITK